MHRHARTFLLLFVLLILAGGLLGRAQGDPAESATPADSMPHQVSFDAEAYVAAWTELWSTYDLNIVDELFLASPAPTYFSSEKEGLIVGLDAIREHHAGFGFVPGGSPPAIELWLEDVHTTVFGTTAVVNATWYFGDREPTSSGDGDGPQSGPMTAVFVLDGDVHKIAHMHFAEYLPPGDEETEGA
jgi:hypothetical protein